MKALAILSRLVFSILLLIVLACYLQVSPTVSLNEFCNSIDVNKLIDQLLSLNYLTISLFLVLLLSLFSITRILDAVWNMLFCASILVLLAGGLYTLGGPGIALPNAIYQNEVVNQICQSFLHYEVPLAITIVVFAAGWLCASASGRVAITAVISYGLWYGITEFFTYATHLWASTATPALPEVLYMIQGSPWMLAAIPGAFFLIYALLMAFFETYISNGSKKKVHASPAKEESKPEDSKPAEAPAPQPDAESRKEERKPLKPVEPATKTQPILKAATPAQPKKLKPVSPAASEKPATNKVDEKPTGAKNAAENPKEAEKPTLTPVHNSTETKPEAEKTESSPKTGSAEVKEKAQPATSEPEVAPEEKKDAPQVKE